MVNQENISVVARIRPFSDWIGATRKSCIQIDPSNLTITVKSPSREQNFAVNTVFNENSNQGEIYARVGRSIVDGFVEGINGTIFAYGQTGSGKTYTMIGPDTIDPTSSTTSEETRGIIPRALQEIFAKLNAEVKMKPETFKFSMKCSFLELYNEKLYDLLQDDDAAIKIQSCFEQITVVGAAVFDVTTYEECMHYLRRGWNQRKVAETSMNRESSRSHAVFLLTLETEHTEGTVINRRLSRLNMVDLAGSERQGQTNNTGAQLKEAGNINKSLSILARVIRTLASAKPHQYIPYRDSLLTFLLRDSLGGNARTTVVVNIHPNSQFVGDTISTLNFAVNVQKVKNTAHVNEKITCDDIKSLKEEIERLRNENREIKSQLASQQSISKAYEESVLENQKLRELVASLQSQVASYLNRSARRGFADMLEHDPEVAVPGKISFDDEENTSVLTNAQRKHRRQTQFIAKPVQKPSDAEILKKLAETEKALEEEEKIRSESELEVNKLHQVVAERDDRIRELESMEKETNKEFAAYVERTARLEQYIADRDEQISRLEKSENENIAKILMFEEEKESMDSRIADVEFKCEQELERMKEVVREANQSREMMRLEKIEFEKQREAAMKQLAESNGHLNHSQKIHHLEKLKNEMTALKNENAKLKSYMKAKGVAMPEKENKEPKMNCRW